MNNKGVAHFKGGFLSNKNLFKPLFFDNYLMKSEGKTKACKLL